MITGDPYLDRFFMREATLAALLLIPEIELGIPIDGELYLDYKCKSSDAYYRLSLLVTSFIHNIHWLTEKAHEYNRLLGER